MVHGSSFMVHSSYTMIGKGNIGLMVKLCNFFRLSVDNMSVVLPGEYRRN
jgi:hypothetical protein